ncbi:DNA methyltransferase [Hyphomicrobium sp. LHD-15]|uniref:site-specific DNA-methyltransferase n=1 Tax=Hyphomicrobium sp. LHD-15 TaxID=3072142 RepID=UPI00280C4C39|nr:DNA methyltransferase [Hyphomicrobium sp. LHD-15]MDQ8699205.1 DNA methyltransferase [Hyphomicrobium sp. LHD-15]
MASRSPTNIRSFQHPRIEQRSVGSLKAADRNARTHSVKQIGQIAESIRSFGFVNPVLVDQAGRIVAGHGRVEAARKLGIATVPVLCLTHLSDAELRAYALADNRLAELSGWDKETLSVELAELATINCNFDMSVTGFDHAEIDLVIQTREKTCDPQDEVPEVPAADEIVSRIGDLWVLGQHRVICGDARDVAVVRRLMGRDRARMVFTDPPYNVPIDGHVSGLGRERHRDFACASGEMSAGEFTKFLETVLGNLASLSGNGSLHYVCMDWRHLSEMTNAGASVYTELKNMCVWNKTNGGMGSFYRSKHELVFVYKHGKASHTNNVELGRFGRYRSNVWEYAGVNTWRKGRDKDLKDHPTVKPVLLVADAIQDASNRGDLVLDGFGGSGTTLIAAERVGRRARLVELEPKYVDVTIRRWEKSTGQKAVHAETGLLFGAKVNGARRRSQREADRRSRG